MKKILFAANTSWYLYNFRRVLMRAFRSNGWRVVFCAPQDGYTPKLAGEGFEYCRISFDRKGTNLFREAGVFAGFVSAYAGQRPDMVLHFTPKPFIYGSMAARILGIPCVNTVTGLGYVFLQGGRLMPFVKLSYRAACGVSRRVFFQNPDDRDFFIREKLVSARKVVMVPGSGVNTGYFQPGLVAPAGREEGKIIFLFYGRLLWDKGLGEYIAAARSIRASRADIEFWLLGFIDPGNPAGVTRQEVAGWESEGLITYFEAVDDVRPYLEAADCVVLPSYREGTPRSLLEALAMEKPIITTDAIGCRQVVEDGVNGFAVAVRDSRGLAGAMAKMAGFSAQGRRAMGSAGRRKVAAEFDEKTVVDRYVNAVSGVGACR